MGAGRKVAFWSPVDTVVARYVAGNTAAKALSAAARYWLVASPGTPRELAAGYAAKFLRAQCDGMWEKAVHAMRLALDREIDVLVRVDIDAGVFRPDLLIPLIDEAVETGSVVGNGGKDDYTLRGGCLIVPRSVLRRLPLNPDTLRGTPQLHDAVFSEEMRTAGVPALARDVFEESEEYSGRTPVWHPKKCSRILPRYEQFMRNQAAWT
jgi:hypothetical protein